MRDSRSKAKKKIAKNWDPVREWISVSQLEKQ
jgi:hypothetical protein